MPAKTLSPEAAQQRVYKSELKALTASRRKIERDTTAEFARSRKEAKAAQNSANAAQKAADAIWAKHEKRFARIQQSCRSKTAAIDRRIGILNGRLGL